MMTHSLFIHLRRTAVILFYAVSWLTLVHAQEITAERYVAECRAYVLDGNEIAARGACGGALQLDPTEDEAGRLLAELDLRAGNFSAARARLEVMQSARPHSDTLVLLASIAVATKQPTALEQYLTRIASLEPPSNAHAVPFLQVQLHLLRGEYTNAVHDALHSLSMSGTASDEIILTELTFLIRMRQFALAEEHLRELPRPVAPLAAAEFDLLAARLAWATGNLKAAQAHYETAFETSGTVVQHEAYTAEHEYALVLLGRGQFTAAYKAWLSAESRAHGRWWLHSVPVTWVTVLLLFIALTIVAESNIPPSHGRYAPMERQALWSAGGSLTIVGIGALVALAGVIATSIVFFGSWIAVLAPPNVLLLRMLFVAYLLFTTGVIALITLQRYTKSALHELRGLRVNWGHVVWGGVVFAGSILGWEAFVVPRFGMMDIPFEMFASLPVLVLFTGSLALGEIFFRAFVIPTFQLRYSTLTAVVLAALLYGFVVGAPVLLVTVIGVFHSWLYIRNRSGLTLAFVVLLGMGLLFITTSVMPQLRALFF